MPTQPKAGTAAATTTGAVNPLPTLVALGLAFIGVTLIATSFLWWGRLAHPTYSLLAGLTFGFVAMTIPLVRARS